MATNSNRRNFIKASAALSGIFILPKGNQAANAIKPSHIIPSQRTLGSESASMQVSPIGLGCMGMSYHRSFVPDKRSMIKLLQQAKDFGVNLYDTAEAYGPFINETLVGEALTPFRKEIMIATKFGFKEGKPSLGLNSHPKRIRQVLENSLISLRTDYIDLFYQHRVDPNIPIEDVAGTVKDFIAEGKCAFLG